MPDLRQSEHAQARSYQLDGEISLQIIQVKHVEWSFVKNSILSIVMIDDKNYNRASVL